jgi:Tfp pilus assembly protein PilN
MRPVNLLPQNERAVKPADGLGGSSYIVLGVLGALLLAVLTFVVSQNQVNDRSSQIAKTEAEAQQAEQRVATLGAFGSFASVKEQREQSVRELAGARFDWERFMRELSLVLPEGTSLLDVSASTDGAAESTGAGGAAATPAPAPAAGDAAATGAGPKADVTGCAVSQSRVATLLVRLGKLKDATDVALKESAASDSGAAAGQSADSAGGAAPGSNTGCPAGKFMFDVTVTFAPAKTSATDDKKPSKTPARLGGGA